jgi:hypothetical protein
MEYIQNLLSGQVGQGVLNLLLALFILIVGWIVARIIARIVRGLLKRTDLDNRLASYLVDPDEERVINIEDIFGKVVFWLLMLFVLAAFFQQLGLAQIATPISVFLQRLTTDYLPRFGGAALLTGIAWLVATVLRFLVKKLVSLTRLDERMSEHGALEEGEKVTFGDSLATAVFWFVLLLFLPSILTALGIGSIADQFKVIFDQIFAYIPSILAAAVVFLIGLFLARAIRLIIANLLKSIGTDKFGQQVGLKEERLLSDLIASLIYMFVLLVIIAAALRELNIAAISDPMTALLAQIINIIPGLIGAALLLVVTYAIARIIADLVKGLLSTVGFNTVPEKLGLNWSAQRTPSEWAGQLILILIMLFSVTAAFELLGSEFLVTTMDVFLGFLWQVFLAAVIFAFGLYFANLAYNIINRTGINNSNFVGRAAQAAVIIFTSAMALREIGVGEDIINLAFGISLGAVALAFALAFGLGSQRVAERELEGVIKSLRGSTETSEE